MAVPVAVKMAKAKQTAKKYVKAACFNSPIPCANPTFSHRSTDFLARANNELFAPHGLFAVESGTVIERLRLGYGDGFSGVCVSPMLVSVSL